MFTQRATAYKVCAKDIISNEFVNNEGETAYVLINGNKVSRARILATIVNKFTNDERKSGTIILDDGTEVISARGWENEFQLIDPLVIGQLVDVIGRVRQYNDEVYLIPEIIKKVEPNWLVLRKLELRKEPLTKKVELKEEVKVDSKLKDKLFDLIKSSSSEGAKMDDLIKIAGDKKYCTDALMELIDDDLIFEPRAGRYKAL